MVGCLQVLYKKEKRLNLKKKHMKYIYIKQNENKKQNKKK